VAQAPGRTWPGRGKIIPSISTYLYSLRERVAGVAEKLEDVIFEFFVPFESMFHPIDQWCLPVDVAAELTTEIGFENAVVIRDLGRNNQRYDKLKQRWRDSKSKMLLDEQNGNGWRFSAAVIELSAGGVLNDLYKNIDANNELVCLILNEPVADSRQAATFPCIRAALCAGLPLIIWARTADAADELRQRAFEWLNYSPQELPKSIRELRRSRKALKHLPKNLTVMLENGDYAKCGQQPFSGARS
jgi:hypothetical protein